MSEIGDKIIRKKRTRFACGAAVIHAQVKTLPDRPGVYRMLGEGRRVLYVGKAKSLKKRVASYTRPDGLPNRIQRMVAQTRGMEIVVTGTEAEALLLEASLIQRFAPPFNILFRDDKSYPYIVITRDYAFPQLLKHRGKQSRKGWYFGPFASSGAVDETLTLLQRAFMLRNCSNTFFETRKRPCLQYHIKRCTAPCTGKVTPDGYALQVDEALDFLRGKSAAVQKKLAAAMQAASGALDYERAAVLRDRIRALTAIQARQDVHRAGLGDADVIALHQAGGRAAIQVFFYRADRNYGTRTFFPTRTTDLSSCESRQLSLPAHAGEIEGAAFSRLSAGEMLGSFITQFYADKPVPPLVLLSAAVADKAVLEAAFEARDRHKVRLVTPVRGGKKRLVDLAVKNAREALGRKIEESAEQEKLLCRVGELFALPEKPRRIEVYDNSHTSGGFPVGAMIAAGPEGFLKKTYRKFNIREASGSDDTAMMREVLTRRFRRLIDEDPERHSGLWPDLILIDGGQGQLNRVLTVLQELGVTDVTAVGIAKGPDRNAGRERFFLKSRAPLSLPSDDPLLYYLQRLRDEAHRFAIGTHRARRTKALSLSGLEAIPGIGATRKKALLHYFGSAKAVSGAGLDDLIRVEGISPAMARRIYDHFRG